MSAPSVTELLARLREDIRGMEKGEGAPCSMPLTFGSSLPAGPVLKWDS